MKKFTVAGTDIEEVKRKNAKSGLSYNEVKALLAQTGGHETAKFSDTDPEDVKKQIHQHPPV
ncbi:gamma-type small acid-soluble spore protein [Ornithinibacillus sp. 179-J 7C1 HS]|uniref:gamma-type small acid-soluble spore protein n=1 Tax=Ornithinibacillus sp. 179-J 7C1 HS TaxID=3142384 RepID=UPI00399FA262